MPSYPAPHYHGIVAHGLQNGRNFGYPTANIEQLSPDWSDGNGVFAAKVRLDGQWLGAMLYTGTRPTLNLTEKTLEIHIFDFSKNIYGQNIDFQIIKKIREEIRFNSTEALIQQLQKDEQYAREILAMDC